MSKFGNFLFGLILTCLIVVGIRLVQSPNSTQENTSKNFTQKTLINGVELKKKQSLNARNPSSLEANITFDANEIENVPTIPSKQTAKKSQRQRKVQSNNIPDNNQSEAITDYASNSHDNNPYTSTYIERHPSGVIPQHEDEILETNGDTTGIGGSVVEQNNEDETTVQEQGGGTSEGTSSSKIARVFGRVLPLTQAITYQGPNLLNAYAATTCSGPRIEIYDVETMTVLADNPLAQNPLDNTTNFSFNPKLLGIDLANPTRYMLRTSGCTKTFERVLTSFYKKQDLTAATTLIAKTHTSAISSALADLSGNQLDNLTNKLNGLIADDANLEDVYTALENDLDAKNSFINTFGDSPDVLLLAAPDLNQLDIVEIFDEKNAGDLSVDVNHWNASYIPGYEWYIDNNLIANTPSATYTPSANSLRAVQIKLIVGHKNVGDANVDRSKPYHVIELSRDVNDTFVATPPLLTLEASSHNPSNTLNLSLELATGTYNGSNYANCETFSSMAITEDDIVPDNAQFTITCQSGATQVLPYALNATNDGTHTIYLWAKDANDSISSPQTLSLVIDRTLPFINFTNLNATYRADRNHSYSWQLTDENTASTQNMTVDFFDGVTWINKGSVSSIDGPLTNEDFSTTILLPNQQISNAKIRVSFTDLANNTISTESPVFDIVIPELEFNIAPYNFANTYNKSTGNSYTFSITNNGTASTLSCSPVELNGTNASEFVIQNDACNTANLAPNSSCQITVAPRPNTKGTKSATLSWTCGSDSVSNNLTYLALNNRPSSASAQSYSGAEDQLQVIALNAGSDLDGDTLSYDIVTPPSQGTLANCLASNADLLCDYQPNAHYFGSDSFSYRVYDGSEYSSAITNVSLTITSVNDAPVLGTTQSITTNEDTAITFNLNAATDIENDPLTYTKLSDPSHGSLNCVEGSSTECTYTPAVNTYGSYTFTYKANDGSDDSNIATVTIVVNAVNDAPVMAANQTITLDEDTVASFTLNSATDVDLPAQTIQYKLVSLPSNGSISNCITNASYGSDLTCDYTPNANFFGTDSFTFIANDGITDAAHVATVNLNITSVNDAPTVASTQTVTTAEDTPITFDLNLGSDIENDTLTYIKLTNPTTGNLNCVGGTSPSCTYTPDANDNGSNSFTYKVSDGSLDSNVATVTIIISAENDAPVMIADQIEITNEDTSFSFTLNGATDIDLPAQTLGYKVITPPAHGVLSNCITAASFSTDLTCDYTPTANYNGSDSFTYRANDGISDSATFSTVTITIASVNDAPTLSAVQNISTNEDTVVTFDLDIGADIENDSLTYIKVTNTTNGTINCVGGTSRSCTYTPSLNYYGSDSFTYKVNDGSLDSNTATVNITVNSINDAPVMIGDQTEITNEDTLLSFTLSGASDVDLPAQTLQYKLISGPSNGVLSNCISTLGYTTDITCDFLPNANFYGTDSFTYRAYDSIDESVVTSTVTITVLPINDAPTLAATQSESTNEDTTLNFSLSMGTDTENDTLSYIKVSDPAHGTLNCTGGTARTCTYVPDSNYNGTDSFTYKVNDGNADSNTATVTITVIPVNDAPTLVASQSISTNEDTPVTFDLTAGSDIENDTLVYITRTSTSNGTINCLGGTSRSCTYTPSANYNGSDSFTYLVNDGELDSTISTVTITVNAVNDAPTLAATQSIVTDEDTPITFDLAQGSDPENDTLTYIKVTNTSSGSVICTGGTSRSCTYTPNANAFGSDSFTYKVNDGSLDSNIATVSITVNPVNDRPVMGANQNFATNDNTPLNFTLSSASDVDLPAQTLSYKIVSPPAHGTLTNCINDTTYVTDITCTYTSVANYNGTDSFTYIANDGLIDANSVATVTITVTDATPPLSPSIQLASDEYSNSSSATFTATSCSDTPFIFFNEGSAPTSGAAGWQACNTLASGLSYTLSVSDGVKNVKAWAKDSNGNVSPTATSFAITYDTTAPVIGLTSPTLLKGGASYSIQFTVTELNTSSTQNYSIDFFNGSTWSSIATPASQNGPLSSSAFSYAWTVPALNISNAKVRVTLVDLAGNSTAQSSSDFTIDSIAPSIAITSPAANSYHQSSLTLAGTCETGAEIEFSGNIPASFSITCSGGSFSQLVNLDNGDGTKTINIKHTDPAGNNTNISRDFIRDEVAPALALTTGDNPGFTKNDTFTWSGTCEDNYLITVTGTESTSFACSNGTWSWTTAAQTIDGTYNYSLTQTDAAGNTSTPLGLSWERDGTAPPFTISSPVAVASGGTGNLTNNLSSLAFSGNCEGINTIVVSGETNATFSCSSSSWNWTSPVVSTDATRTYTFTQTDGAGNTSTVTLEWTRDTTGPAFTVALQVKKNNDDSVAFGGNCEDGLAIDIAGAEVSSATCTAGVWTWTASTQTTDATRNYDFSQTNAVLNTTLVTGTWIRETDSPIVTALSTTATEPTKNANLPITMQASSQNSDVSISHICLKSTDNTKPLVDDTCWRAVNGPNIGLPLNQNLNMTGQYYHLLGWGNNVTYSVYAWVKDEAENISDLSNSGLGTAATDTFDRTYDPGTPPAIFDVIAANTPSTPIPPTRAQASVPAGSDVYIRWKTSDNQPLPSGAISIFYSADEITFTQITGATALDHDQNYGCSGYTTASDEGCFKWTGGSPLNSSYKIRVRVTDASELSAQQTSNALNSGAIKIIAGNTESGLGGSAISAMFYTRMNGSESDPGTLVVANDGRVYFNDYKRGILTIDPNDGKQKIFIPMTGTSSGDGGAATNATLKYATKIALDYQNRLLIMDYNRIRRVNLNVNPPTIQTIIGGGSDTSDTVANPLDVQIYTHSTNSWTARGMAFFAMPNGDIYFHSDYMVKSASASDYRIRVYKSATNQVISRFLSGSGDHYDPAVNLQNCRLQNPGFRFDPNTSNLTGVTLMTYHHPNYVGCEGPGDTDRYSRSYFDPDTLVTIAPKDGSFASAYYYNFTGMDGNAYVFQYRNYVNRINFDGTYTRVLGSGTAGTCSDGTTATSCNMIIQDVFVTASGKVYFTDNGVIRTVDNDGKVVTLFGQSPIYGNGVNALNARFANINTVARLDNQKIVVGDSIGYLLKEFSIEGNINIIAGNGNQSSGANYTTNANAQGMYDASYWEADKSTGNIYTRRHGYQIMMLNRSTGKWEASIGGSTPAVEYWNLDGQPGIYSNTATYRQGLPIGFDQTNKKLLLSRMMYNSPELHYEDFMLKTYDVNDQMRQSHLAGTNDPTDTYAGGNDSICATPAVAATCKMPYYDRWLKNAFWDEANNRWIMVRSTSVERDIYAITPGGNIDKIARTTRNIDNAALYLNQGGVNYLYYCYGGRFYKHNVDTNSDLGALTWPISTMSCSGYRMEYNPTNNSIIFPFEQNGLSGVGEYFL